MTKKSNKNLFVILLILLGVSLGMILKSTFDYAVVEINPVDVEEAEQLFNEAYSQKEVLTRIDQVVVFPERSCKPVFRNTIEKRCEQDIRLYTSSNKILLGHCYTWSYKSFVCEIPNQLPQPSGDLAQALPNKGGNS